MTLPDRVLATVRKHRMIPEGGRVIVALSGGPDSVALTLLLKDLEATGAFQVAGVAHVNHRLRESADSDEAFCRAFAGQVGVPCFVERVDVRAAARRQRRSLEDAGRLARYGFFTRVLADQSVDVVATGHTRDDQAETVLLRLVRGAGSRGLAGIRPTIGRVVRPLFDVRRQELRDYLSSGNRAFCDDETNRDLAIPRNRVRHELIPYLERTFSPGIVEVLAREGEAARRDDDHLQKEAIESSRLIVLRSISGHTMPLDPDRVSFQSGLGPTPDPLLPVAEIAAVDLDVSRLSALSPAIASRVVRLALSILAPDRFVGFDHVEAVLALAAAGRGGVSLPGQEAVRRDTRIEFVRAPFRAFTNSFCHPLSIPGEVILDSQGWSVSAELGDMGLSDAPPPDPAGLTAAVREDRLVLPLLVRSRRPGDRFQPSGLGGRHRKVQDVLVDRKVPRASRDSLPLVVDAAGRIVWIAGHGVAEDFRVTAPSQGVIFLKARRLGGPG